MMRMSSLSLHTRCSSQTRIKLLLQFLKGRDAKLVNGNYIRAFADDSDDDLPSRCVFDIEATEENAFSVLERMLTNREVLSFDFRMEINGRTMYFNCDPSWHDQLLITILADPVLLDDGMIDFTWYYEFWKEVFTGHAYIHRVEFDVDDD